jgi:hypothetical protein
MGKYHGVGTVALEEPFALKQTWEGRRSLADRRCHKNVNPEIMGASKTCTVQYILSLRAGIVDRALT